MKYISIDCEAYDDDIWWSFAFVMSDGDSYTQRVEFYADRSGSEIKSRNIKDFWNKHSEAMNHNIENAKGKIPIEQEIAICSFINMLKHKNPNFYLISDNISFDIRMIDNILKKHDHAPMCERHNGIYRQPIDVWCYMLSISHMTGKPIYLLRNNMRMMYPNIYTNIIGSVNKRPHTSIFDACEVMALYLAMNTWVHNHISYKDKRNTWI